MNLPFNLRTFNFRDTSKWYQVNDQCFLGGKEQSFTCPKDLEEQLKLYNIKSAKKYFQLKLRDVIYSSSQYKRASKTINSVAYCAEKDGSTVAIRIHYFLYEQGKPVVFCGSKINLQNDWQFVRGWKRSVLKRVDSDTR